MKTTNVQNAQKSIFICSLVVFMLYTKPSPATPSNRFTKTKQYSIYPNSPLIRMLKRTKRSDNEEKHTTTLVELRSQDLAW